MILDLTRLLLFPGLMAYAAISDVFTMTISNRISMLLIAGFAFVAFFSGMSWSVALLHLGAGGLVLIIAFACFSFGWIGGGDAKLAACAGLWFGFDHLLEYLIYASLFGGALTLLLLQARQWPLPAALSRQEWLLRLHHKESGIPYGVALALGALVVYPDTNWIKAVDLTRIALG
jgi:prepilin peptidase CpaA